jgi:hypothetical protein
MWHFSVIDCNILRSQGWCAMYSPTLCPQEQYLNSAKDDVDTADVSKVIYSFGPRFYAEV